MNRFAWDRWAEGAAFAVALSTLPVVGSALADHKITPSEWSMIGTTCAGAGIAYLKTHRPEVELDVPPELVSLWEQHKAEAEKAALGAVLAALRGGVTLTSDAVPLSLLPPGNVEVQTK